jgi:hypothetical protein
MEYEKIKQQKINEAIEFYKMLGINIKEEDYSNLKINEEIELKKIPNLLENIEFHWTRLSNNSNIGYTIE